MTLPPDWIVPDWPTPPAVKAIITTRQGGTSEGPYASMNLGARVNDDPAAVAHNRALLDAFLPAPVRWLSQVHGTRVVDAADSPPDTSADAAFTHRQRVVCAVMVADCLPVLLCDDDATVVAAVHAGWRGLAAGVIEAAVDALRVQPGRLQAYLGPAIGPDAFEVGDDVRQAFTSRSAMAHEAFRPHGTGKWLCNLFALARQRLRALGIERIAGGVHCTHGDPARFYSHRRDRISGRMAALIWLDPQP